MADAGQVRGSEVMLVLEISYKLVGDFLTSLDSFTRNPIWCKPQKEGGSIVFKVPADCSLGIAHHMR